MYMYVYGYCFDRRYVEDKEFFYNFVVKSLEIKGIRKVLGGSGL